MEIPEREAIRHTAAKYSYDTFTDEPGLSLRGNADEVAAELSAELQKRLLVAGVEVVETRLTHLAYAEIASAMLQRQQAIAIIAARENRRRRRLHGRRRAAPTHR